MTIKKRDALRSRLFLAIEKVFEKAADDGLFEGMLLTPSIPIQMTDGAMKTIDDLSNFYSELNDMGNISE